MLRSRQRQPATECRFCRRNKCFYRIVAIGFDEVACPDHVRELELFADAALPLAWPRVHKTTCDPTRRGRLGLASYHEQDARGEARRWGAEETPTTPALTVGERDLMRHALGIQEHHAGFECGAGYRNRFVTDASSETWTGLVARGLARVSTRNALLPEGHATFYVTRRGRVLVGAPLIADNGRNVGDDDAVW